MKPLSTRRQAIVSATVCLGLGVQSQDLAARTSRQRPNILWLVSEDNSPFIGAYGDRLARTPNIDALAARGVLYQNAFCGAPVCAPSRFSILTGINAESCAPANHMRARAHLPDAFQTYPEIMREAGYFCTNNPKTDYNCDVDPKAIWDIQGREGHWRNAPEGQPFMCVLNLGTSHESQTCEPVAGVVTPDQIRVPAYLPDTPGIREAFATYYNLIEKMDAEVGMRLAQLESDGLAEDTIVFYYSDDGGVLPRSKRFAYEEGLSVALCVYVPPKWQGLMPSPPGTVIDSPVTLLDLAPTLLAIAGVRQPPQMTGRPLFGRASDRANFAFGARDRMDERYDFVRTVSDGRWRYIRNYMPHRPGAQHITTPWSSRAYLDWEIAYRAGELNAAQAAFFEAKPYEELYDLANDPDEVANLIGAPEAEAHAIRLRRALDAHMLRINDNGFIPEGMVGEGYFESRDANVYPLRRIMALASAAAGRAPSNLAWFTRELGSEIEVVRYWAAMGILILGEAAESASPQLEAALSGDPSPYVRIVAAEALAGHNGRAALIAVEYLASALAEHQPDIVQLYAVNALTYIGDAARPAMPAIEAASRRRSPGSSYATDENSRPYVEYVRRCADYLIGVLSGTYDPRTIANVSVEACRRAKGFALMGLGSEGTFQP